MRYFCARPEPGKKRRRRHRTEFEFLELRTFLSAGWDLTLIDSAVANQAVLRRALVPGGRVILYNGKTDSAADVLSRVTDWAEKTGSTIKSISMLSEGAPGRFEMGNQWISNSTLLETAPDWERLSQVLAKDAVLKLYGCDLADPLGAGQQLIDRVAGVTGAQVFATTNLIGRSGDWAFDAAVKQLNPLKSSSLISFPSSVPEKDEQVERHSKAMDVKRSSADRASLALTPGGAKSVNTIRLPADVQLASGAVGYSIPRPKMIQAAVGAIAGGTNRIEPTKGVVLLDTQLPDSAALEQAVLPGTNLITYDGATQSAAAVLSQVIEWAQTNDVRIGSLSILSHGYAGAFELGNQWISNTVLAQTAMEWRRLGDVLAKDATVDIFGCDVAAAGSDGQPLIDKIANLTGGEVFASTNLTGNGGDWNLEAGSNGNELSAAAAPSFPLNAAELASYPESLSKLPPGGANPANTTVPGTQTTDKNVPLTFSSASGNSIAVGSGWNSTQLTVTHGTLTLSGTNGLNFSAGTGSGDTTMTFSGTQGNMNAALDGLVFTPTPGYAGSASLQLTTTKPGLLGLFPTSQTNTIAITVLGPTVGTAATASPSPVTANTTSLSVLGVDSSGASTLTYTWATTGSPPAAVAFSANGTNAAKNSTATFTTPGTYNFQVTIADARGLTATSSVAVQVKQQLSEIVVLPSIVTVPAGTTQQCTVVGYDQFGNALATQPAFTWSVTGGGSITQSGLYTAPGSSGSFPVIKVTSGSCIGLSQFITVANSTDVVPPGADSGTTAAVTVAGYSSSYVYTWSVVNKPAGAPEPTFSVNASTSASQTVCTFYQSGLYEYVCNFGNADGSGTRYCAAFETTVEQTPTSIAVNPSSAALSENGTQLFSATADDQFGDVMSPEPAFSWSMNSGSGSVSTAGLFTAGGSPGSSSVQVTSGSAVSSASITVTNAAPTVAMAAAASPSPATGTSTALSVLGADDGGASHLTYQWATTGTPPAAVTFSANGNHGARNTTARFTKAGTYNFQVTISDGTLSTTSSVSVTVAQTLTTISVSPATSALNENQTQQFSAAGYDQFGDLMTSQPTFTWTKTSGVGSISTSGLYTAPSGAGSASVTAASGSVGGSASITVTDAPPTVATAATASPGTVTGTTTALHVLGADDGGAANLTYSWSVLGKPAGAAVPSFSLNGSNAARDTTATFSQAGSYLLEATITDAGGLSTTSSVHVTVDQTFTSIAVTPANASVDAGTAQQYSATAFDQFGMSMAAQPSLTWAATNGVINSTGLYTAPPTSGSATVSAANGNVSGVTSVTIVGNNTAEASPSTVTGNSTTLSVSGGGTSGVSYTWSVLTEPTSAASPTFSANGSSAAQTTTATFFAAGDYTFQVAIRAGATTTQTVAVTVDQTLSSIQAAPGASHLHENGKQAFSAVGFDQFGQTMLTQPSVSWAVASGGGTIDGSGLYSAAGSNGAGIATITASSGSIGGSANITVTNAAPTIATAAAASPSPLTGTTTLLSVLGADDGGESNLTYTWNTIGTPPAGVGFSTNGNNAAKDTIVSFTKAGDYQFLVTITDAEGLSVNSSVSVRVYQTLTDLALSPASPTVVEGASQQFSATATDQFGNSIPVPSLVWSVRSGTGFVDGTGLYTAARTPGITTVSASSGSVSANATITVPNQPPTVAVAATGSPRLLAGTSTALSVLGADDGGESNLTYTWSTTGTPPAPVEFSTNASNAAKNTVASFTQAGDYQFLVTITDAEGLTVTSSVSVTVNQTLTSLALSPTSATVAEGESQLFSATATDQFGNTMPTPSLDWLVGNDGGTIDNTGLYTAPTISGTAMVSAFSGNVRATATITVPNEAPTVAIAAAASTSPVTSTSTTLSVLGADDNGEPYLTYTWRATGTPPAPVSFSANGTNDAKMVTATFSAAGSYELLVTITDAQGATARSSINVIVAPILASMKITPEHPSLGRAQSVQLTASVYDQFGAVIASQPAIDWSIVGDTGDGNAGSIDSSGLYTAPPAGHGAVTVVATAGNLSGTASVDLVDELSATAPAAVNAAPGVPVLFDGANAISIIDGDSSTAAVPVSITISATHGTISLSGTSGLNFLDGTQNNGALLTFSGTIVDVNNALRGMAYTADAGFAGSGSVTVIINKVGTGKPSPSYPIAINVITPSIPLSNGGSDNGSNSNSGLNLADVVDNNSTNSTQTTVSPSTNSTSVVIATNSTSVVIATNSTGDVVVDGGTSSPTGSVTHTTPTPTPTPAKQNDSTPKPTPQPMPRSVNTQAVNGAAAGAAMPNAPTAVPDIRVEAVPEQVFPFLAAKSEMSKEMDAADDKLVSEKKLKIAAGSATVASFGASAAYVLWMLRGGSLLSSLLSILPAWQSIDPLPVLDNFESRKRRKNRMKSDDESLESMVDKSNNEAEHADVAGEKSATDLAAKQDAQEIS